MNQDNLAILGGEKTCDIELPHDVWPPNADLNELNMLSNQRNIDIAIAGRTGPIRAFEEQFLHFMNHELKYAISFNSGTSALFAAYFALGVEEGVEVMGPVLTYHAALSPVFTLKGTPILIDVDIKTRCINPDLIEGIITDRTKIITVVHQWGQPANMDKIIRIAKKHDLKILEDCSHAHGSRYKGRLCGTFGDVAVFSLQTNKAIFAGEGGILVTNNEIIHDRVTLFGHYRDRSRDEIKSVYRKYWESGFGLKLRMSPFNAIVAQHSLKHFPKRMEGRHKCLNYFIQRLKEINYIETHEPQGNVNMGAWYGFKPLYKKEKLNNIGRDTLINALKHEGLEISVPSGSPLCLLPLYTQKNNRMFSKSFHKKVPNIKNYPVAKQIEEEALSMPTFYIWEKHKSLIDLYIDAFKKIERHQENLKKHEKNHITSQKDFCL